MYCMDENQPYQDEEWALIVSALSGTMSPEETTRLRQWLEASPENARRFERVGVLWKEDVADYPVFEGAGVTEAWRLLKQKVAPPSRIGLYLSIAAAVLLAVGVGWWGHLEGTRPTRYYETASAEQKTIPLPDGSVVVLYPRTRLEVADGFNGANRTVVLVKGRAGFIIAHSAAKPFIVDMDRAQVRDISTRFTIENTKDSIKVSVTSGKIAFLSKGDSVAHDVAKGGTICLTTIARGAPAIREVTPALPVVPAATTAGAPGPAAMRFTDAALFDVLGALEERTGKRIYLEDPTLGQERLTIDLEGKSFDDAAKRICTSLRLKCVFLEGAYVFEKK